MRRLFALLVVLQLTACAMKPFPPPTIEGRAKSLSQNDLRVLTALAEREMRYDIGWAVPIERIQVHDYDHVSVVYSYGRYTHSLPMKRIDGVWVPPAPGVAVTSGWP